MSQKKYASLQTLQDFLSKLRTTFADISHEHTISDITDYAVDDALSATSENPVQNKVINAEFDSIATAMNALDLALDGKADSGHSHNDVYYTESEVDEKIINAIDEVKTDASNKDVAVLYEAQQSAKTYTDTVAATKSDTTHNHDDKYDAKGAAADAEAAAKDYADTKAADLIGKSDIVDNLTTDSTDKPLSANQGMVIQAQIEEINNTLEDILYEPIAFTSFTNNIGTVELGSVINTINFTWGVNKTPTTLTLDNTPIDVNLKGYAYNDLALSPTTVTTTSYTIKATDERDATATKSTSISFVNGVYYGVVNEGAEINSATVLTMNKKLQNSRGMTVTIAPSATQYIAFAFPTRLGTPTFKMGGFETTCNCTTIQFTNASGYTESYDVYLTAHTGLGKTEVVVS